MYKKQKNLTPFDTSLGIGIWMFIHHYWWRMFCVLTEDFYD